MERLRDELESFKRQSVKPPTPDTVVEEAIAVPVVETANVSAIAGEPEEEAREVSLEAPAIEDLEVVEEIAPAEVKASTRHRIKPLTSLGLAERLGCVDSTISRNKDKGNPYLRKWSKGIDPDGIAWEFRKGKPRSPQYHPLV